MRINIQFHPSPDSIWRQQLSDVLYGGGMLMTWTSHISACVLLMTWNDNDAVSASWVTRGKKYGEIENKAKSFTSCYVCNHFPSALARTYLVPPDVRSAKNIVQLIMPFVDESLKRSLLLLLFMWFFRFFPRSPHRRLNRSCRLYAASRGSESC